MPAPLPLRLSGLVSGPAPAQSCRGPVPALPRSCPGRFPASPAALRVTAATGGSGGGTRRGWPGCGARPAATAAAGRQERSAEHAGNGREGAAAEARGCCPCPVLLRVPAQPRLSLCRCHLRCGSPMAGPVAASPLVPGPFSASVLLAVSPQVRAPCAAKAAVPCAITLGCFSQAYGHWYPCA